MDHTRERRHGHTACDRCDRFSSGGPTDTLAAASDRVARSRDLSDRLFKEAKRMPQYQLVLANKARVAEFRKLLLRKAHFINLKLDPSLCAADVEDVTNNLVDRVAVWDHSPERQRSRQRKQAAARRKKNRGRDWRILRLFENGMSPARIAKEVGMKRSGVRHVLARDMPVSANSRRNSI